jgi:glutamate dehydrogenase
VLLKDMTDAVAEQVLAQNHSQTLALSLMEAEAPAEVADHADFVVRLEQAGKLKRNVEGLPYPETFERLREAGEGLSRPELAILLAYGKLSVFDDLVSSDLLDDPRFEDHLLAYFPQQMKAYADPMRRHRLRREIMATALANDIVDIAGPTFQDRVSAATGCAAGGVAVAFLAAGEVFGLRSLWNELGTLDEVIPADTLNGLYRDVANAFRQQTHAFAMKLASARRGVDELVEHYRLQAGDLGARGDDWLSGMQRDALAERCHAIVAQGVPEAIAMRVAMLGHLGPVVTIADIARDVDRPLVQVAQLHSEIGSEFHFDRLAKAAQGVPIADTFDAMAVRRLIWDLRVGQGRLTRKILQDEPASEDAQSVVANWILVNDQSVAATNGMIEQIDRSSGIWTVSRIMVASSCVLGLGSNAMHD